MFLLAAHGYHLVTARWGRFLVTSVVASREDGSWLRKGRKGKGGGGGGRKAIYFSWKV